MNPQLLSLLTRIAETLERIERQSAAPTQEQPAPAAAPPELPLLDAIARTYGAATAVEVAAQVEIARAAELAADNGTPPQPRKSPRRWSSEFPEMREMLSRWNHYRAKAETYRLRVESETDETARLFFQMEMERAAKIAHESRSAYDARVRAEKKAARQNQTDRA